MSLLSRKLAGLCLSLLVTAAGCGVTIGYYDDHLRAAKDSPDELHSLQDAGRFGEILDSMVGVSNANRESMLAGMRATREQLGLLKRRSVVRDACRPFEVRMIVHADFERLEAIEMITWQFVDGKARLLDYRVAPRGEEPVGPTTYECLESPTPK